MQGIGILWCPREVVYSYGVHDHFVKYGCISVTLWVKDNTENINHNIMQSLKTCTPWIIQRWNYWTASSTNKSQRPSH